MYTKVDPSLDRDGVVSEIERLTLDERAISDRRNTLHARIDSIYLAAPLQSDDVVLLDGLEALEQQVSAQRARVHEEIDVLRLSIGLPRWRERQELDAAA